MSAAAAALALAAGLSVAPPAAASRDGVVLLVMDCYTATPPIEVEVNGKALALTPAAARDDSVALCYDAKLPLPATVRVRLRRGGAERVFNLKLGPRTKAVGISASGMTARALDQVPGID